LYKSFFGFTVSILYVRLAAAATANPDAAGGKMEKCKSGKASVAMESVLKTKNDCRQDEENISFLIDLAGFNLTLRCHFLFCMRVLHVSFLVFYKFQYFLHVHTCCVKCKSGHFRPMTCQ